MSNLTGDNFPIAQPPHRAESLALRLDRSIVGLVRCPNNQTEPACASLFWLQYNNMVKSSFYDHFPQPQTDATSERDTNLSE